MKTTMKFVSMSNMIDGRWLWKICLLNMEGEPFVDIGLENTMDEAYATAKKKYDALLKDK